MKIVANVRRVVDQLSGLVKRFFSRAYAMESYDALISQTLTNLAPTEFRIARVAQAPKLFRCATEHGTLENCATLADFHANTCTILESILQELEQDYAQLQGITVRDDKPVGVGVRPRFSEDPYLVVTTLLETANGQLIPQLKRHAT